MQSFGEASKLTRLQWKNYTLIEGPLHHQEGRVSERNVKVTLGDVSVVSIPSPFSWRREKTTQTLRVNHLHQPRSQGRSWERELSSYTCKLFLYFKAEKECAAKLFNDDEKKHCIPGRNAGRLLFLTYIDIEKTQTCNFLGYWQVAWMILQNISLKKVKVSRSKQQERLSVWACQKIGLRSLHIPNLME